jgi:hypothetical protein
MFLGVADFEGALAILHEVFRAIFQAGLCLHLGMCHLFQRERVFPSHFESSEATDSAKDSAGVERQMPSLWLRMLFQLPLLHLLI